MLGDRLGSNGIVRICPYCQFERQFAKAGSQELRSTPGKNEHVKTVLLAYQCIICHGTIAILADRAPSGLFEEDTAQTWPAWVPRAPEYLPTPVAACLHEGQLCASVRAWNAAAVLIRRSVEEAIKDKGGKGRTLEAKIDNLADQGKLVEDLRAWAHEVRYVGNDGAHGRKEPRDRHSEDEEPSPPIPTDVSPEEAHDAIRFAEQLFHYLYIMPAQTAKARAARNPTP